MNKNNQFSYFLVLVLIFVLINSSQVASEENVYICTGNYSKVYHSIENCKGLRNCKAEIKSVSLSKAKKMGRRACRICVN
ncbi:MAG TPA: hypothetical protein DC057_08210 [Spirochaetia bacterium]|nr:hypothetical protein [Spirochaetia bacterium]